MWLLNPSYNETVEAVWVHTVSPDTKSNVLKKVEKCGKGLTWWNKVFLGMFKRSWKKKRKC